MRAHCKDSPGDGLQHPPTAKVACGFEACVALSILSVWKPPIRQGSSSHLSPLRFGVLGTAKGCVAIVVLVAVETPVSKGYVAASVVSALESPVQHFEVNVMKTVVQRVTVPWQSPQSDQRIATLPIT